jgi:predicted 2-oxoglutarate/Fe(II)-dependent dioxygenase YbiX
MRASLHNIVKIPNFLSEKEITHFLDLAKTYDILNDPLRTERAMLHIDGSQREVGDCLAKVKETVEFHCGFSLTDLCGTAFRKWLPGEHQEPHADCEASFIEKDIFDWDMSPINNFSSLFIEYAALVYLSDDYEGGEIYFPDYGIDIKPSPGDLIFFPGTEKYRHGVREIASGSRYVLMTFFTTPKLQYIWKYFVLDDSPLRVVKKSEEDQRQKIDQFTRQNVPESLTYFGNNLPEKLDIRVIQRKVSTDAVDGSIFGKNSSNIQVVDGFMSEDDAHAALKMAKAISTWNTASGDDFEEWIDKTCGADILSQEYEDLYLIVDKYANHALKEMENYYKCVLKYREPAIVRWRAGMHTPEPHADKHNVDGTPKAGFEDWDASAIIYLNDDFDGGELVFPQHSTRIKPRKGSLVFFPGDDAYIHYVDHISSGTRWTIPMFFTFEKFEES